MPMLKSRTALAITAAVAALGFFLFGAIIGTGSSGKSIAKECRDHSSFKHVERDSEVLFNCRETKRPVASL
jgi:hypothetical protein